MERLDHTLADKSIAEQAAEWVLALEEGDAEQQARTLVEFQAWQAADPRHAQVAETVQSFIGKLAGLKSAVIPARHALDKALSAEVQQASTQSKPFGATLLSLVVLLIVPLTIWLGRAEFTHLTADLHSASGEWQSHTLADGSHITLAGKSAVDIRFDAHKRELHLLSGEILVDVAKDAQRPFVVTTGFGQIEALGTRFIVNHQPTQTHLAMIESSVQASASSPTSLNKSAIVSEGEQVDLDQNGVSQIQKINAAMREQAWHKQQLVVRGWSLAEVLRELARYHPAYFYVDEQTLPAISVSAVLPLDKPDAALQLLSTSFPSIRVENLTPWVRVIGGVPQDVASPDN